MIVGGMLFKENLWRGEAAFPGVIICNVKLDFCFRMEMSQNGNYNDYHHLVFWFF